MNPVLTIDPEFEAKCLPLTGGRAFTARRKHLGGRACAHAPSSSGTITIVDGHNRYRIAQAHPGVGFHL